MLFSLKYFNKLMNLLLLLLLLLLSFFLSVLLLWSPILTQQETPLE